MEPDPLVFPQVKVTDTEFTPGVAASELGADDVVLLNGLTETDADAAEYPPYGVLCLITSEYAVPLL